MSANYTIAGRVNPPGPRLFFTRWLKNARGHEVRRHIRTTPEQGEPIHRAMVAAGLPVQWRTLLRGGMLDVVLDHALERGEVHDDLVKARDWVWRSKARDAALHVEVVHMRRWWPDVQEGEPSICRECRLIQRADAWVCAACGGVPFPLAPYRWTWRKGPHYFPKVVNAYHPHEHLRMGHALLVSDRPDVEAGVFEIP